MKKIRVSVMLSTIRIGYITKSKSYSSFHLKIKLPRIAESGKPALCFRCGGDGVVWCHILIEIASPWTIVGSVFGCVIRSAG